MFNIGNDQPADLLRCAGVFGAELGFAAVRKLENSRSKDTPATKEDVDC